jgi:3'-phosphoadenosine 5'-phosphosulfate (PAPS) 3'-phosphatase
VILREAGGKMTDLFGEEFAYNRLEAENRNGLVASNGIAHARIIDAITPLLKEFGRTRVK